MRIVDQAFAANGALYTVDDSGRLFLRSEASAGGSVRHTWGAIPLYAVAFNSTAATIGNPAGGADYAKPFLAAGVAVSPAGAIVVRSTEGELFERVKADRSYPDENGNEMACGWRKITMPEKDQASGSYIFSASSTTQTLPAGRYTARVTRLYGSDREGKVYFGASREQSLATLHITKAKTLPWCGLTLPADTKISMVCDGDLDPIVYVEAA